MTTNVPAPVPGPDSAPFWEGLREHTLRIPFCHTCDRWFFPPMPGCPECGAGEDHIEMREVAGTGRVHSWFVAHHAFHPAFEADVPYAVLDVDLDEGPRINGRFIGAAFDRIKPGMVVRAAFEDLPEFTRLAFEPVGPHGEDRR
ncbi:Zn-ribbon domain-containing OB-fold protein [Streptomyces sp. NPDC060035]|uniref:Zn-ribbon domain-containing OB-fold protein n=1 Tax=Streptomyces sp. NPDC060035 TaxID=3347044 RepID=UPI0036737767